jgi:hypothetical protein
MQCEVSEARFLWRTSKSVNPTLLLRYAEQLAVQLFLFTSPAGSENLSKLPVLLRVLYV